MTNIKTTKVGFWQKAMLYLQAMDTSEGGIDQLRTTALKERIATLETRILQLEGGIGQTSQLPAFNTPINHRLTLPASLKSPYGR